MVVKIRFLDGRKISHSKRKNRHVALGLAALLTPGVLTAIALGCWRLAADLGMASQFAIADGFFSHWQVWFGIAVLAELTSLSLNRYGRGLPMWGSSGDKESPEALQSEV